jgi:hypothetical protein
LPRLSGWLTGGTACGGDSRTMATVDGLCRGRVAGGVWTLVGTSPEPVTFWLVLSASRSARVSFGLVERP